MDLQFLNLVCRVRAGSGFVVCGALLLIFNLAWIDEFVHANEPSESSQPLSVRTYRSGRIELRTDLPSRDANALMSRLDGTLSRMSKYWRQPLDLPIICFVIDDLSQWPHEALPHSQARLVLRHVKGGTDVVPTSAGGNSRVAHVYATAQRGVAEHELVHAYCMLVFGKCGPDWYKEGMAELANRFDGQDRAFQCNLQEARRLNACGADVLHKTVTAGEFTLPLKARFGELYRANETGDDKQGRWNKSDDQLITTARRQYDQSWALCYFLANNPNYQKRFRQLGMAYLAGGDADFETNFAPVNRQLAFEYAQFLQHASDGYRVDLCSWNWKKEAKQLHAEESVNTTVVASRGYQPTGIHVAQGECLDYEAAGSWRICGNSAAISADGRYLGRGCLEAVILHQFSLSEPILLGAEGTMTAPRSGHLHIRCRDHWNQLADNSGRVLVEFRKPTPQ